MINSISAAETPIYIDIPEQAHDIIRLFENKYGAEMLVCGGYVLQQVGKKLKNQNQLKRPLRLSERANDIDLVTNATPAQIQAEFPDCEPYIHLVKFGIYAYKIEVNGLSIDIAHRAHMTQAEDLFIDASKRCCSIKSMYANKQGLVIDPMLGVQDLKNGILRINGNDHLQSIQHKPFHIFFIIDTALKIGLSIPEDIQILIKSQASLLRVQEPGLLNYWLTRLLNPGQIQESFLLLQSLAVINNLFPAMQNGIDAHAAWLNLELTRLDKTSLSLMQKQTNDSNAMKEIRQEMINQLHLALIICELAYQHKHLSMEELYLSLNKDKIAFILMSQNTILFPREHQLSTFQDSTLQVQKTFEKTLNRFIHFYTNIETSCPN